MGILKMKSIIIETQFMEDIKKNSRLTIAVGVVLLDKLNHSLIQTRPHPSLATIFRGTHDISPSDLNFSLTLSNSFKEYLNSYFS